jgi:hypothetical protein
VQTYRRYEVMGMKRWEMEMGRNRDGEEDGNGDGM